MNIDVNNDLVTDRGYDVTLAIRYDVGPLAPGQESNEPVMGSNGVLVSCSDEDLDTICLLKTIVRSYQTLTKQMRMVMESVISAITAPKSKT